MDRPAEAEIGDFCWFLRERGKKHAASITHILSSYHSRSNRGSGSTLEGHKLRYPNSIFVCATAIAPAATRSPLRRGCSLWSTGWVSQAGPAADPLEEYGTCKKAQKRVTAGTGCPGMPLNFAVWLTCTPHHQPKLLFLEAGLLVLQTSSFSRCCRWLIHHEVQNRKPRLISLSAH